MEDNKWNFVENPDLMAEQSVHTREHPKPEQLLIKLAAEKALKRDQKKLWELYNYSGLTVTQIAKKLKLSQPTISKRIKVIEKLLTKFCLDHKEAVDTMNEATDENIGC